MVQHTAPEMDGLRRLVLPVDLNDYPSDADMPQHPGLVLLHHVTLRTAQVGSAVGLLVSPFTWLWKTAGTPFPRHAARSCLRGTNLGVFLGIGMCFGRATLLEGPEVVDRGYRVWHNVMQVRTDQFAYFGALVCGSVGALTAGNSSRLFSATRGSAIGLTMGTLGLLVCRTLDPESEYWKVK